MYPLKNTYRGTNPHIGINVLAIQYLALTLLLFRAKLILVAAVHLTVCIITAVLLARVLLV